MNHAFKAAFCTAALVLATSALAQTAAPAGAPAGSAGQCKDGTYSTAAKKSGACSGHQGVKTWWGASAASGAAAPAAAAPAAPAAAAKPAAAPAPAPAAAAPAKTAAPAAAAAPGGGPGQVWVNTGSKVYHCPGTEWYGKTKQGQYMSEADAKAAGNKPDHGKSCS